MSAVPLTTSPARQRVIKPVPTHLPSGERFVRWTTIHGIFCWPEKLGGHPVGRALFVLGQAGMQCLRCNRRLYVLHHIASEQVLTVAASYDELIAIQRERMTEFEALHYLGVIAPPGARA